MVLSLGAITSGLLLLVWSADRFIAGSAATARHVGLPPLLIGMIVVGFGTSVPEMMVSVLAAWQGNPGIALGNAFGSNISNIGLILGIAALINPITVQSGVLKKELPILCAITFVTAYLIRDFQLSKTDAWLLLLLFFGMLGWTLVQGLKRQGDTLGVEVEQEFSAPAMPLSRAVQNLFFGLIILIVSSRLLVWGAIRLATDLGVNELLLGLTVVAVGTSLPELASSIMAARKSEHDIALGNVIGSNLFNTLAVLGVAGVIQPVPVPKEVLLRDLPVMTGLTLSLFLFGYGFRRPGRINRWEGAILVLVFFSYSLYLVLTAMADRP
ncbi:MAG: calcium/sodium antiporter [Deltaproteobacteria bacterium]|jgi:cation:H+ antiporter|nr:calcium/sodium antiporter [Deltaproteobacteria bacterium]